VIGRITTSQLVATSQRSIGASKAHLARLQQQLSSGSALTKPSDDPGATAAALRVRSEQQATTQYGRNINDGLGWLSTVDSAMTSAEDLTRKAVDLTIQGGNSGTMSPESREAIATQLDGLRADLLGTANSSYLGRSVFAGSSDAGAAFDASYAFTGTVSSTVERRIGASDTVTVDADGAAAFGSGTTSVFATIDSISAALRAGDGAAVSAGLTALQRHMTALSGQHAVVGARYARLEQAKQDNMTTATTLETQRSGIEDVDPVKATMDLQTQQVAYQTALAVTAKVIQPTLMSFLS
jgi:flagellar hook-associated protein 3 FlgL